MTGPEPYKIRPWGEYLATRNLARRIRLQIEESRPLGAPIVLDFAGVIAATRGFLDSLICPLVEIGYPVTVVGADEALRHDLAVMQARGKVVRFDVRGPGR